MAKLKQTSSPVPRSRKEQEKAKPEQKRNARSKIQPGTKPITDAVLALVHEDLKGAREAAKGLLSKAKSGDLRAFVTLREVVEGKPMRQRSPQPEEEVKRKYEDVREVEERILELLQRSPELLKRLDQARKTDSEPS